MNDLGSPNALGEVCVGAGDHRLLEAGLPRVAGDARGDGVVGLEADHRPDGDAERAHRIGGEPVLALYECVLVYPLVLVRPELRDAHRSERTVEGDGHVGGTVVDEQVDQAVEEAADGAYLAAIR